ncbi:MAG: S41 family peptidase [Ferruginibacter sp.]
MSKGWRKFVRKVRIPSFPLEIKLCEDTMVVTENLNRKDSLIKKGMLITSINGVKSHELIQQMLGYFPLDGYSDNVNYIRISNDFPFYHRAIFGLYKNYRIGFIDSVGNERTTIVSMFVSDSENIKKKKNYSRKQEILNDRSLVIDSSINTGVLSLNTFIKGSHRHLRSFYKRSFKKMAYDSLHNCIVDLRFNGGGDIDMYVLLAKYLRNTPFRVADTAYAVSNTLKPYTKYISQSFFDNLGLFFLTKKHKDGNYHFGFWERHIFKPKKNFIITATYMC